MSCSAGKKTEHPHVNCISQAEPQKKDAKSMGTGMCTGQHQIDRGAGAQVPQGRYICRRTGATGMVYMSPAVHVCAREHNGEAGPQRARQSEQADTHAHARTHLPFSLSDSLSFSLTHSLAPHRSLSLHRSPSPSISLSVCVVRINLQSQPHQVTRWPPGPPYQTPPCFRWQTHTPSEHLAAPPISQRSRAMRQRWRSV